MKILLLISFVGLAAVSTGEIVRDRRASASAGNDREATLLRSAMEVQPDGFNYVYETSNGIAAQASGVQKGDALNVQGEYSYTSPEGVPVKISYTGDEEGFKPVGDLLPVPPPTPDAIIRSLKYIAEHPPSPQSLKKQ